MSACAAPGPRSAGSPSASPRPQLSLPTSIIYPTLAQPSGSAVHARGALPQRRQLRLRRGGSLPGGRLAAPRGLQLRGRRLQLLRQARRLAARGRRRALGVRVPRGRRAVALCLPCLSLRCRSRGSRGASAGWVQPGAGTHANCSRNW